MSALFRTAASVGSIQMVQWIFDLNPLISTIRNDEQYLSMDDITYAHLRAGHRAVAVYLERRCPLLFPKQLAIENDQKIIEEARFIFCPKGFWTQIAIYFAIDFIKNKNCEYLFSE